MTIFAIDPSNIHSSYLIWNGREILGKSDKVTVNGKDFKHRFPNPIIEKHIVCAKHSYSDLEVVIETLQCFGMPIGDSIIKTAFEIGRFQRFLELSNIKYHMVKRTDIKMHHCSTTRAKDSNIRQALIDRFGEPGRKKEPGLTYGLAKDLWSAFAIATYWYDNKNLK